MRELAMKAIQEPCAYARALRADKSRTREAGQLEELALGDRVDFWRKQATKEESGWIGPAAVVDISHLSVTKAKCGSDTWAGPCPAVQWTFDLT